MGGRALWEQRIGVTEHDAEKVGVRGVYIVFALRLVDGCHHFTRVLMSESK